MSKGKLIGASIIVLWIISTTAGYLGAVEGLDQTWRLAFRLVARVSGIFGVLLMGYGLWLLGSKYFRTLFKAEEKKPAGDPLQGQKEEIGRVVKNISELIKEIGEDAEAASVLVTDVKVYTETLVSLIRGIVDKGEKMRQEAGALEAALDAILSGDRLKIAAAAGGIPDSQIRQLMITDTRSGKYWEDVTGLISTYKAGLTRWAEGYEQYTGRIMREITGAKLEMLELGVRLDASSVNPILLQSRSNLEQATQLLRAERRLGRAGTAMLPAVVRVE